jgi:hypothetical protein
LYGVYRFKAGFMGCLGLPVKCLYTKLWHRMEPVYYRLRQKLKDDTY